MPAINVVLSATTSGLSTGLSQAKGMVKSWGDEVGGMVAGAFAFGAIISGFKEAIDKAGQLGDAANTYDIGTDKLQQYGNAAILAGSSLEDLTKAFDKMLDKQQDALSGNAEAIEAFRRLGISVNDLKGADVESIFLQMADGVANASDKSAAFGAMLELLGKKSSKLFPLFSQGSEAIKESGDSMLTWSGDTVSALEKVGDQIDIAKNSLLVIFGEALLYVMKLVGSFHAGLTAMFTVIIAGFMAGSKSVGAFVTGILDSISAVKALVSALIAFAQFDFKNAKKSFSDFTDGMKKGFNGAVDGMLEAKKDLMDGIDLASKNASESMERIWNPDGSGARGGVGKEGGSAAEFAAIKKAAEDAKKAEEALKKAREDAEDARAKSYYEFLDAQAKINFLQEQFNDLARRENETTQEGLEARKEMFEVMGKLKALEDAKRKAEEDSAKRIAELQQTLEEAERNAARDRLSNTEKLLDLEAELAELKAAKPKNEEDAVKNRLKQLELEKEIADTQKKEFDEAEKKLADIAGGVKSGLSAPADFLQAVGGGGNVNESARDSTRQLLDEFRKQRSVLQEIAKNTGQKIQKETLFLR